MPFVVDPKAAPIAAQKDWTATYHDAAGGRTLSDPWHWLRDPDYPTIDKPEILDYLKAENAYYETAIGAHQGFIDNLFDEIKGRIPEEDESVPWTDGVFEYRWRFEKGSQYRIWSRRQRDTATADWTTILDENAEAEGKAYFKLGDISVSPDGKLLAWSADDNGSERFTVRVRHIESGTLEPVEITETSGEIVWSPTSDSLFTVKVSDEWRPFRVDRTLLSGQSMDPLYEEQDTSFFVHVGKSADRRKLIIRSGDHVTGECWVMDLGTDIGPELVKAREAGHDYSIDHGDDGYWIRSNRDEVNFTLFHATSLEAGWVPVFAGSEDIYVRGFSVHKGFTGVSFRHSGQDCIMILTKDGMTEVSFDEAVYTAEFGHNPEYAQDHVRLRYSSMVTPDSVFDYQLADGSKILRKQVQVPSGYDASDFTSERIMVTARDGTDIPVSIVMHKDWAAGPEARLHLYGYGAYGISIPPSFSAARISLLERGFAYAIAHIRGGDDLGYGWYQAGKLERRTNTFHDFVDVARELAMRDYGGRGRITISGGSAGGELMGAVINEAPELFGGCVIHVPFVDVLNTMLDASLPLTPIEWPEWGNPIDSVDAYDTIASYCPYSNLGEGDYPPILVTGGLNDPRVTYWEPAKYVAKLRTLKQNDAPLLMKINMGAGHGGKSGRFERYREVAEEYAFLCLNFGIEA